MKQRPRDSPMVQISKTLTYVLRHGAKDEGIEMRPDGYVLCYDILKFKQILKMNVTLPQLELIVKNNDKKRFEMTEIDGRPYIRASQGHTIKVEDELLLKRIEDPHKYPTIIHGTFLAAWDIIKEQGLNCMARNHIHFAIGLPGDKLVISGMRGTCDIYIEVDMEKAMNDGIKFYESANQVVLSSGIDRIISPQYFKRVTNKNGDVL